MPEIIRTETKNGFVCVWQLLEDVEFFTKNISSEIQVGIKKIFNQEERLKEKFAPHFILKKNNPSILLNNINLEPKTSDGFISISHCKEHIAVIFDSQKSVGIDIEFYTDRILKIRHKFLNDAEKDFCKDDAKKSLIIWSAKEAIFKKFGNGTVFFKENISIENFNVDRKIYLNGIAKPDNKFEKISLLCELFDEFILVHTL